MTRRLAIPMVAGIGLITRLHAQTSAPEGSQEQLRIGVAAFKNAQFGKAVEYFQAAVQLDPA